MSSVSNELNEIKAQHVHIWFFQYKDAGGLFFFFFFLVKERVKKTVTAAADSAFPSPGNWEDR